MVQSPASKNVVTQLVSKLSTFMEAESSFTTFTKVRYWSYSEAVECTSQFLTQFLQDHFYILHLWHVVSSH
jgi:hypothetical protein